MDNWLERSILAIVLGILVFGSLAMGAVPTASFLVIQGAVVVAMILWGLRLCISQKPQLLWPPLGWVVLAFTALAIGRYFTADIEYVARQELIQVLVCTAVYFIAVNNLYRQEYAQIISFTLIFLGMGIAGYAAFQFFTHSNHVWHLITPYVGRGTGTYISPNNLAGFLEMLIPLAFAYVLAGRMKPLLRILLGYAALVMMVGLMVTFSRGGWMACSLALFFLLGVMLTQRGHRLPALALLVVMLGSGTLFVTQYLSKTASYIKRTEVTNDKNQIDLDLRAGMWRAAEQMWRDNFWFGTGPAHFDYRFREYRPESVQARPDRAHNDYLNLLADWGVIGGIIVLAGMATFAAGLWKTWRHVRRSENDLNSRNSNRFAFFTGAAASLLALAVHSTIDFNLHIPANALIGVTLLALLSSNLRFATENYWVNMRLPLKSVATAALAISVIYLGYETSRHAREYCWLSKAERLPNFSYEQAAAWEKAFAVEPMNFTTSYNIGEVYRTRSFEGGDNYANLAKTAMDWYARGIKLNPHDGYNYLRTGMCLDWLDRHAEAPPFLSHAEALDPNGYFTVANIGWHYLQTGDYPAAKVWCERSLRLKWSDNPIASSCLKVAEQKLAEQASGKTIFVPQL